MAQASYEPGTSRSRVLRSAVAPHWLGATEKRMKKEEICSLICESNYPSLGWDDNAADYVCAVEVNALLILHTIEQCGLVMLLAS